METSSERLWLNTVLHAAFYVSLFPKDAFVPFLLPLRYQKAALNRNTRWANPQVGVWQVFPLHSSQPFSMSV